MNFRLSISNPKRTYNPANPHLIHQVHVGLMGRTISLKRFCEEVKISYPSLLQSMKAVGMCAPGHYNAEFHKLVVASKKRAERRKLKRQACCPTCGGRGRVTALSPTAAAEVAHYERLQVDSDGSYVASLMNAKDDTELKQLRGF
jgi:hypothetical protein